MNGSGLCGAAVFEVAAPPRTVSTCHCRQCRRQSGHVWSSPQVDLAGSAIAASARWYAATKSGKRGFCGTCGSLLTWKACDEAAIAIALGAVDGATPFKLEKHIFAAEKSNYYEISESVPQF